MEQQPDTITGVAITSINNGDSKKITIQKSLNQVGLPGKRKRSSPMHIFKVAMHMLKLKTGKSKSSKFQAASALKNVVGSMLPLHLQSSQTPPRVIEAAAVPDPAPKPDAQPKMTIPAFVEQFEACTPLMSPAYQASSSSSISSASRYASANDLQELWRKESEFEDKNDEAYGEDEEDKYYDDKHGDDMIDSKAEEFIARFYEQMRLQHRAYN